MIHRSSWLSLFLVLACDAAGDKPVLPDSGTTGIVDAGASLDATVLSIDAAAAPGVDAARAAFVPSCRNSSRCSVCVWTEGTSQRCRVSIFGGCPREPGAPIGQDAVCPANPSAACDRSPGFFDGPTALTYADWDFYYGSVAATAEQDCLSQSAPLARDAGPRWVTY